MAKYNLFITKEATKYWKKQAQSGNLCVAVKDHRVYVLNGYNAFIFPDCFYAELLQPATMNAAPADGAAYIWQNGGMMPGNAADVIGVIERVTTNAAPVWRTRFSYSYDNGAARIYKLEGGDLAAIDCRYDSMIDHAFSYTAKMATPKSPAIFEYDDWTALLMPLNRPDLMTAARDLADLPEF